MDSMSEELLQPAETYDFNRGIPTDPEILGTIITKEQVRLFV